MKIIILLILSIMISAESCSSLPVYSEIVNFFKARITVQDAINEMEQIEGSDNPAYQHLKITKLKKKCIKIEDIVVKDIITSLNVDYTFCVIVTVPTNKGPIECYIYANDLSRKEDIGTISMLEKGKTRIDIDGEFSRFFSLLDKTYTKVEVIKATIKIKED